MVPKRIKAIYKIIDQSTCGESHLIDGVLKCCNSQEFEVYINGEVKHGFFSGAFLSANDDDDIMIDVHCKKCGSIFSLFDSRYDGYEQQFEIQDGRTIDKLPFRCKKCGQEDFSVRIKFEYPDVHELQELGLPNPDNAFTWIWATLKCNNCQTIYKNFVDYET